jgi:hypothetical protein
MNGAAHAHVCPAVPFEALAPKMNVVLCVVEIVPAETVPDATENVPGKLALLSQI